jgi:3-hydroxy-9,10-secoandrosta-1,3,5(10)-triene-9,17-dione monooxygenase reductase component
MTCAGMLVQDQIGAADCAPSGDEFRAVLGNFPTGVVGVTAMSDDGPVGMTVGTFTSVSLDPPLVGFLPAKTSDTWPKIRRAGRFAVNVLHREQEVICRALAHKTDKFAGIAWHPGAGGAPLIEGAVAWIECELESVTEVGDHFFVVGRVDQLPTASSGEPLIFFRRGFGGFSLERADCATCARR